MEIRYQDLSEYLKEYTLNLDNLYDRESVLVIDNKSNIIDKLPVTLVVRNYHPLGGLENENHKTLLKAGHHIIYNGKKRVLRCGNLNALKFIYEDSFYFTDDLRIRWRLENGHQVTFVKINL